MSALPARPRLSTCLLIVLAVALAVPTSREAMLTAFQRRFLYFPIRDFVAGPSDYGFDHEEVILRADDGVQLHAWWLPVSKSEPGARTVLFLHGNAGNVSYWAQAALPFRDLGWDTLLLDYRGYGRSHGEPTEEGTYLDARAAWLHLVRQRGIDPSRIVVIGRSLGGAVAIWLATDQPVQALVLESTFTSIADVAAGALPIPGLRSVVRLGYPSLERMGDLDMPLLVLHGRDDELIPISHGRALASAAAGPTSFVELRGGHNDAVALDATKYSDALREFGESLDRR